MQFTQLLSASHQLLHRDLSCYKKFKFVIFLFSILFTQLFTHQNAFAFDQTHSAWKSVLTRYVVVDGNESAVRYLDLVKNHEKLDEYLKEVSAVTKTDYDQWSTQQKLAFLINAYNALTIKLIIDGFEKKPEMKSINDLGTLLQTPWKIKFFTLFGQQTNLDHIEQDLARPNFDEPRMHMAFNCASLECPALLTEPYLAEKLESQLEESAKKFLKTPKKNRFDKDNKILRISSIFKWYGSDFDKSKKFGPLNRFLADRFDVDPKDKDLILHGKASVDFLDYDWGLNIKK